MFKGSKKKIRNSMSKIFKVNNEDISQMITKVLPVISRIVISYAMKQGEFYGKSIKTETTT